MRDHDVTIAKALAIILMVLGHVGIPLWLNNYIGLIHMPLFFFMSGYCFKVSYLSESSVYIRKRIKGVYWPYVKWTMVFVLLHNVFFSLGIYNDTFAFNGHTMHEYTLQETLRGLFDGVFMRKTERLLGGFWFLKSLFYGNIFFFVTRKFVPKLWCGALLLLCATVLSSYLHLKIPFLHINSRDCFAAFFIMIGHIARNTNINGNKLSNLIITNKNVIAFFIMSIGLGSIYWPTSMLNYQWYHIIPYATTAIMGTFVIYSIGHYINVNHHGLFRDFLIYTGGYTFNVLTWHFLSFKLVSYLIIVIYGLPYSDLADFPIIDDKAKMGWWLAYVTIGVMLPLSCKYASTMILQKVK